MIDLLSQLKIWRKKEQISIQEMEFARFLHEFDAGDHIHVLIGASCFSAHLNGHICIDIDEAINHPVYGSILKSVDKDTIYNSVAGSKLVGDGSTLTPLVMDENRVYLHKFWKFEQELADWLNLKSQKTNTISNETEKFVQSLFDHSEAGTDWQKIAVLISIVKDLVIISGGPGTGKTFTIQKIIDALSFANPDGYSIALAAPTGKAAQRLTESLILEKYDHVENPVTIHKLLGAKGRVVNFSIMRRTRFRSTRLLLMKPQCSISPYGLG